MDEPVLESLHGVQVEWPPSKVVVTPQESSAFTAYARHAC